MKELIKSVIYKFIELVEDHEYRNLSIDENDSNKKILYSIYADIQVMSDTGLVDATQIHVTQPYKHYNLELENGISLSCADNHIVFSDTLKEIFVKDLIKGDYLSTNIGISKVRKISKLNRRTSMGDLTIDHPNHRYYTNGILSHNTVCASITILHFVLFNNNKNALVTANKLDTAIEILDKMREIYEQLPFFLQQGIITWNQKVMTFQNKSRVKCFATTKTSSIGQAADFLYLDEFAYLPDNIADKFYKSVFPTVANIENSKIIITSTPNGYNLFHKLLVDAEKPEGEKSNYTAKRVYWWQVPKRYITYFRLDIKELDQYEITKEELFEYLKEKYPKNESKLYWNDDINKWVINTLNDKNCEEDDIREEEYDGIKFPILGEITTWKKECIKDIGGEEAFNQEFDLKFINASRSLLEEGLLDELQENKEAYEFQKIDELDEKLKVSYKDLRWTTNKELYDPDLRKSIKGIMSIDIAEGLGQDYSVINIFRLIPKTLEEIEKRKDSFKTITDFYKLVQIGIYRSNVVSVQHLAEIYYIIQFEHFDPENFKSVVELNQYGNELIAHMPGLFEGRNEYGSSIFFRFKHRVDSEDEKVGLKVTGIKNLMVKDYQDKIHNRSLVINNDDNITEMTTFIKHVAANGNISYKADGSMNDDMVMTVVNVAYAMSKKSYRSFVEDLHHEMDIETKNIIDKYLNEMEYIEAIDYSQVLEIRRNKRSYDQKMMDAKKQWGVN